MNFLERLNDDVDVRGCYTFQPEGRTTPFYPYDKNPRPVLRTRRELFDQWDMLATILEQMKLAKKNLEYLINEAPAFEEGVFVEEGQRDDEQVGS